MAWLASSWMGTQQPALLHVGHGQLPQEQAVPWRAIWQPRRRLGEVAVLPSDRATGSVLSYYGGHHTLRSKSRLEGSDGFRCRITNAPTHLPDSTVSHRTRWYHTNEE